MELSILIGSNLTVIKNCDSVAKLTPLFIQKVLESESSVKIEKNIHALKDAVKTYIIEFEYTRRENDINHCTALEDIADHINNQGFILVDKACINANDQYNLIMEWLDKRF